MNQLAGTVVAYLSSNFGATIEWPILERADGSVVINPKLMDEGFPYDAEMGGRHLICIRSGEGVDVYEDE